MSAAVTTIGLIGLGRLGHAVALRLLGAGYPVVGHDVLGELVERLVKLGGQAGGSAAEVARQAEVVCTLLPTLASVEQAILGAGGIVEGARAAVPVLQMSTISPTLSERLARECAARGLRFLDCPISGTSGMVATGQGIIFVGGDLDDYERCRHVLEAILPRVRHVGRAGQATALKLVANLLIALHSAAAAEALNLARAVGLEPALTLEALTESAATSRMLEVRGPLIVGGEYPAQMALELFMKDLALIREAATAAGAPIPLGDVAERLYAAAVAAGHGDEDLAAVVTSLTAPR